MKPIRMTYTPDIFRVMVVVLMADGNDVLLSESIVDSNRMAKRARCDGGAKEEIRSH